MESSAAGAPESSSSTSRVGPGASSRSTLFRGTGCEVAGRSGVTTLVTRAKDEATASSSPARRVTSSSLSATRASAATRATSSEEMADMGRVYPGASKPQPHLDTS